MWPDHSITKLLGIDIPIIQAPMAGAQGAALAVAVAEAGALGSIPCATRKPEQVYTEVAHFRRHSSKPLNLNFFCHPAPNRDADREAAWRDQFSFYYIEFDTQANPNTSVGLSPIDHEMCDVIEELRPQVVSFHFGLPEKSILDRVKATGAKVFSSATTVAEARFLEENGCDAVIAQGVEAGGHRGMFLTTDIGCQVGTLSLVPQVVDAVRIPVIAAGGIADARGIVAAFALGASAVQIGTGYLRCDESEIKPAHRQKLMSQDADQTVLTNIFTGRPARSIVNRVIREVGPINNAVPDFPLATGAMSPLKAKTEGGSDFIPLWSGQSASLGRDVSARKLTNMLAVETLDLLQGISVGRGRTAAR